MTNHRLNSRRFLIRIRSAILATMLAYAACAGTLRGGTIPIPNGSFELPAVSFVDTFIDSWQKTPKPDEYDESKGFLWSYLTGTFKNTPPTSSDHLDNCDGKQAIWMFADPGVGLFQDYDSTDSMGTPPTHAFNATFEAGKSYVLTAAINGGGGGMSNGATMQISLYYRDLASNMVTVAAISITNTPEHFSNHTHLIDFQTYVPTVKAGDPWAGQHIGVQLLSTVSTNLQGGYWDLDNIRLSELPALVDLTRSSDHWQFTLQSQPGLAFEILAATNVNLALPGWTSLGILTNLSGATPFVDTTTSLNFRYYRARQVP
jgi:hypothetical protein